MNDDARPVARPPGPTSGAAGSPSGGPPRSLRRRFVLWLLLALALLLVGTWALVSSPWLGQRLADFAQEQAARRGLALRIEGLELAPLQLEAHFESLHLDGALGPLESLDTGAGRVQLARTPLWRGAIAPAEVEVREPVVVMRTEDDAADDAEDADEEAGAGGFDPEILASLRRVVVHDGRFVWDGGASEVFSMEADGLRIDGMSGRRGLEGDLGATTVDLDIPGLQPISLRDVESRFTFRTGVLEVPSLAVRGEEISARGSVVLRLAETGISVDAEAFGDVELAWLASAMDAPPEGRAAFEVETSVAPSGRWSVTGRALAAEDVAFGGIDLAQVQASFRATPEGVFVTDGLVRTPGGSEITDLRAGIGGGAWSVDADAALLAGEWLSMAGLPEDLARARLDATLAISSSQGGGAPTWEFDGSFVDPDGEEAEGPTLRGTLSGSSGADADGEISLRASWDGVWLRGDAKLGALGADVPWSAELSASASDRDEASLVVDRALEVSERFGAEGLRELPLDPNGPLRVRAWFVGRGAQVESVDAETNAEALRFAGADVARVEARVLVEEGRAPRFWARLAADESGRGAMLSGEVARRAGLGLSVDASEAPAAWVVALTEWGGLGVPTSVRGRFDLSGRFRSWGSGVFDVDALAGVDAEVGLGIPLHAWAGLRGALDDRLHSRFVARGFGANAVGELDARLGGWEGGADGSPAVRLFGSAELDARVGRLLRPLALEQIVGRAWWSGLVTLDEAFAPSTIEGVASWDALRVAGYAVPSGDAAIFDDDGALVLANSGPVGLDVRLDGLAPDARAEVSASWSELDVLGFAERILQEPLPLTIGVTSSGAADLAGPLASPTEWTGGITLDALDVRGATWSTSLEETRRIEVGAPFRIGIDDGGPLRFRGGRGGGLTIGGSISAGGPEGVVLDLQTKGTASLRILEAFDADLIALGDLSYDLDIEGPAAAPSIRGTATAKDAEIRQLVEPRLSAKIRGGVRFANDRIVADELVLQTGGGEVDVTGSIELDGWAPEDFDLAFDVTDVAITAPADVWALYGGQLALRGPVDALVLSGDVEVQSARVRREVDLTPKPWARSRAVAPTWSVGSFLRSVGLEVEVGSDHVVSVRNELVDVTTALGLDVRGSIASPQLTGTISLLDGGRFSFRDVDYEVLAGQVAFDPLAGVPVELRLRAATDVSGYQVRLDLRATPEVVEYSLTSVPALTESEILTLLITGQQPDEVGGATPATGDLAGYFGSGLSELLLAEPVKKLFGLTEFRIGTAQVGPDASPTARVTIGRRLDEKTMILYSRDLSSEGRDVYRIERDLTRKVRASAGREALGGVAANVRFVHRFGDRGTAAARVDQDAPDEVEEVEFSGMPASIETKRWRPRRVSREGALTRHRLLDLRDQMREALIVEGYLETEVDLEVVTRDDEAVLEVNVEPGEPWKVGYEGPKWAVSTARDILNRLWAETEFRPETLRDAERALLDALGERGHAAAWVDLTARTEPSRRLNVVLDPGPKVSVRGLELEGVTSVAEERVREQVLSRPSRGLFGRTTFKPRTLDEDLGAVRTLYEAEGFLDVAVTSRLRYVDGGEGVIVTLQVEEGPRYEVGTVAIEGEWPSTLTPALELVGISSGDDFEFRRLDEAESALRRELDAAGYYAARTDARVTLEEGIADVSFRISVEAPARVEEVVIEGLEHTERRLVKRNVHVAEGELLTRQAIRETERDLFKLGLFRKIEVSADPIDGDPTRRRVLVRVTETPRVSVLGSLGYDTEEKLRVSAGISNDNLFGRGRVGSLQGFGSSLRRGLRATIEDRHLRGGTLEGLISVGPEIEERDGFTVEDFGATLQVASSSAEPRFRWLVRYRLDRTEITDVTLDAEELRDKLDNEGIPVDTEWLSSIGGALIWDRRDDPFLPWRGWFGRSEVAVFADTLGSDASFVRIDGQLAGYQPIHPRVQLAGSLRVGTAHTFEGTESVPISERFFAGGADSLRGFERDRGGPFDPETGRFLGGGGEARLVANTEVRWRVYSSFDLVAFHDEGIVWPTFDDVDLSELRSTWGLGLRWRSPVGPVRIEYGRKTDAREGESGGEWYFSIGEPW